ncbi:hypothetical protein SAMN05192533_105172 [Mesobacillus persicus]|uniref:Uncharacterized protein n=1 Tax=Mesobacillus persicus TaxID=930146 RepID=A0A1H8AXN2_9BACI|nr:hypothetical protein SAMN05192533_105172 [Mesobacillus persicus]
MKVWGQSHGGGKRYFSGGGIFHKNLTQTPIIKLFLFGPYIDV